jgi:endoglucanase
LFNKPRRLSALALSTLSLSLLTLLLVLLPGLSPAAEKPAAPLVSNGDFQTDENTDGTPDGWAAAKGGAGYATEGDNRYLHLVSEKPDQMVMTYRQIPIPASVKALELTWKQRITDLKIGKQAWFDARIMMEWKDAAGGKVAGKLPAANTRKATEGWVEKSTKFLVPEGAKWLAFMPTLFQVKSGTFDLDDVVLKETDAAPIEAEAKAKTEVKAEQTAKIAEKRDAQIAKTISADGSLIANGNLQTDADGDGAPDGWGKIKAGSGISFETEGDNKFLRLTSIEPFKMVLFYKAVMLPTTAKAIEITWKQRTTNLKRGKQNFHDARIMSTFINSAFQKVKNGPLLASASKNTDGWVEKSKSVLVPEGAAGIALMPTLFMVETGTYDLDDFVVKATDPANLIAAAEAKAAAEKAAYVEPEAPNAAKWPSELHTEGTRVLTKEGKEIILQGVNVDSLEWNPRGEQVMKSALVAVDDWKSNCIRLPIRENYWFGKDATQNDGGKAYHELVDNIVNLAANRGAYTMLDLHRFRAPKQVHIDFWKDVATKYKNHPAVIFELFNEPHDTSWEIWRNGGFIEDSKAPADEDNFLTPEEKALNKKGYHAVGMQALVDAVRGTGAKNIVVCGGLDWSYDLSGIAKGFALDKKGGNGLMYATHIYAGKRNWAGKVLVVADKYPIMVSELGANTKKFTFMPAESQEDAATWVPRVLGFIQQHKFHWTAFSLHPGSAPVLISDFNYTPTPEWGALAKRALAGEKFPAPDKLR